MLYSTGKAGQSHWIWVLCLVGLDYFSSLAYQPSISFEAAGVLSPFGTLLVVLITLFGAVPVYCYVAGRSPNGQGAIGLLEQSMHGWHSKLLILILLGFAATDFVITRTISVADAAVHIIQNPYPPWQSAIHNLERAGESALRLLPWETRREVLPYWRSTALVVALLLSIWSFAFWGIFRRGLTRHVVQIAAVVVAAYLVVNGFVLVSALSYLYAHPQLVMDWWDKARAYTGAGPGCLETGMAVAIFALFAFPKVSLGLSGFELSMVVMPRIKCGDGDRASALRHRIRAARKLLILSALIMAVYLLSSALVTTALIPPQAFSPTSRTATNRALAYLAHGGKLIDGKNASALNPIFGDLFGSAYDASTILILCLAGTSVTLGLRELVPQYMHRLGMELEWSHRVGAILLAFNFINLVVTVVFRASVEAQRGAYATSVLVLISTGAAAAVLGRWKKRTGRWAWRMPWYYVLITLIFAASAVAAILRDPRGLLISLVFVVLILMWSIISRVLRTMELRFEGFQFQTPEARFLWDTLKDMEFPVLVPHRPGMHGLELKEEQIRKRHRLSADVPVVFVEVRLGDASDFYQQPVLDVIQEEGRFIIRITECASVAHTLAAAALELSKVGKPPEIHFGWSDESPVSANLNFLLFGRGNIPWMVRELIRKAQPDPERQPRVIIG